MARKEKIAAMVFVERRASGEEEEEHNGTWKLAYADFVTALMTFFLVMWLMNTVSSQQRKGIADYFNPVAVSTENSGTDGMLSGRAVDDKGSLSSPNAPGEATIPVAAPPVVASLGADDREPAGRKDPAPNPPASEIEPIGPIVDPNPLGPPRGASASNDPNAPSARKLKEMMEREAREETERKALDRAEHDLRDRIAQSPELRDLADSVIIQRVPEGLRVQLTDQAKVAMFAVGSARLNDDGRRLIRLVAAEIVKTPNRLSITGHTDALSYATASKYGNWELSSDRANAARRELAQAGVPPERIVRVEGRADLDHLAAGNPLDPKNRRISFTLLRSASEPPPGR